MPEEITPVRFCAKVNYVESDILYDISKMKFRTTARGSVLEFPLRADEQIYGFGLQLNGFNHKNHKLHLRPNSDPVANTGDSHAPVPFFVSTKGYGMYFDTARYIEVYCGYGKNLNRQPEFNNTIISTAEDLYKKCGLKEETTMAVEIPAAKGITVYIFEGNTIAEIVSEYNLFSGGGCKVPEWGLGVLYRCYAGSTERDVLKLAEYFSECDIPCDIIGLEPGWQSSSYSCSYVWDSERFPNYLNMIQQLKNKGYHINLWEHAFVNANSPIYKDLRDYCGDFEVWKGLVPDFATEQAQDIFADFHKKHLVAMGIDGFKLDECDNSDFVHDWSFPNCTEFPSGLDGEQYHCLFGTLYMQTILKALGQTQTLSQVRSAGALCASYPFVLYSDLYDHREFIRGCVNAGFSGILWAPEVRHATSKTDFLRRLATTVFSVQCLINAWYCKEVPWKTFDCEKEVRSLLQTRKALIPIIKDAFTKYHKTGKPPVRALVMDYTGDTNTYGIDDEYLLGDKLLVAPLTAGEDSRMVYIPEGQWCDFWTGTTVENGYIQSTNDIICVYQRMVNEG